MEALRKYTLFQKMLERLLVEGLEDDMYVMSLADNVKLGPRQGADIYRMVQQASEILDLEVPTVFVDTDPTPNAFAFGEKKPVITLTSGLIDTFRDDEIFTVIGHELGHIKCRHTFYSLMARNVLVLMQVAGALPVLGPVLGISFYLYLLAWYRRAELSADRAALLATQSKELVTRTMLKLAGGGSTRLHQAMTAEAFVEQAEEYERLAKTMQESSGYRKWSYIFGTLMQAALMTHPWPALRTREVLRFAESERYRSITNLQYPEAEEETTGEILLSEGVVAEVDWEDVKTDLGMLKEDLTEKASTYGKSVSGYLKRKLRKAAREVEGEQNPNKGP